MAMGWSLNYQQVGQRDWNSGTMYALNCYNVNLQWTIS